ncbi:DUF6542 domain-containing protein [Streptomyces sp. P1-3]|uniref:DUF6542 domain-containing protein n=1 Tax=Streptomyces sp. P1-3 TaxID=3421658 RepID=UPI003D35E018
MEPHSTRPPRRTAAPPPRPAADGTVAATGPASWALALRVRMPRPRLTGFGTGLLAVVAMLAVGCLDALFSGSAGLYGVLYLLTCVACGVWVRPADLLTAPVGTPIAFLLGLFPANDSGDGLGGQAMGVFTSLSLNAGWLYAGTLLTAVIVLVRRVALVNRRQQLRRRHEQQRRQPSPPPRSPRCSGAQRERSRP